MLQVSRRLIKGDRRALSEAISMLERGNPQGTLILRDVFIHTGRSYCIGITGPPGAGKSTLTARLTEAFRGAGCSVGVIAVDPTSRHSGGAILGDRIRMGSHYLDSEVFIRSMATRGSQGGLPRIIKGVVRLLDAGGKDVILVETVGAGQTELDIMGVGDTVIVTLVPEGGDSIQAFKAGLMEIGDIFVVNKADRPGADQMVATISGFVGTGDFKGSWAPPILATQATNGQGISRLYEKLHEHRVYLANSPQLEERRRERRAGEFLEVLQEGLGLKLRELLSVDQRLAALTDEVKLGKLEPYSAGMELLEQVSLALSFHRMKPI